MQAPYICLIAFLLLIGKIFGRILLPQTTITMGILPFTLSFCENYHKNSLCPTPLVNKKMPISYKNYYNINSFKTSLLHSLKDYVGKNAFHACICSLNSVSFKGSCELPTPASFQLNPLGNNTFSPLE